MRLHVGVGAPLARLPVYAVLDLFVDIEHDRFWWWHGAALTAPCSSRWLEGAVLSRVTNPGGSWLGGIIHDQVR